MDAQVGKQYESAAAVQKALTEQQERKAEHTPAFYESRYGAQDQAMTKALDRCLQVCLMSDRLAYTDTETSYKLSKLSIDRTCQSYLTALQEEEEEETGFTAYLCGCNLILPYVGMPENLVLIESNL